MSSSARTARGDALPAGEVGRFLEVRHHSPYPSHPSLFEECSLCLGSGAMNGGLCPWCGGRGRFSIGEVIGLRSRHARVGKK